MSIEVKFRRGTATQHLSFTGANGEITVDTTNKTLRVHDGVTAGGIRLAKFGETSGNTSTYLQVANASALYTTKAYAASNAYVKLVLANTNSYIASRASWSALTSTNTALRTLISDRLQVANARSYMQVSNTKAYLANTNAFIKSQLANTNAYIATKVNTSTFNAALANTNAYIASVSASGSGAVWSAITSTNTALRTLINDRLQVANASATYQTKAIERAALANTNAYIATKLNTTTFNSALANTNSFIKNQLANTNSYISTRATWSALTSTNTAIRSYVDTKVAAVVNSAPGALDTLYELANALNNDASFAVTVTNLIGTKMSVANTKAYLANTNAFIKSQLANTNAYIATRASWTELKATNTAIRALDTAKLSVANAVATYATKSNPTTSGLLAHTGRATISQNLNVSGNTTVTGYATFNGLVTIDNQFGNGSSEGGQLNLAAPVTGSSLGGVVIDVYENKLRFFDFASPNRGAYIDISTLDFGVGTNLVRTDLLQVSNANVKFATKAYAAANSYVKSTLANTNLYIAQKMSVANTKAYLANTNSFINSQLANTNAYIATKVNTSTFNAALANTNAYINSVVVSGGATWSSITSTNTALRALIADRLQVANAKSYMQVSNTKAYLANTNSFIKSQLANTNAYIATKVNTSTFNAALANTNNYIATRASWSALTSTNTSIRTLISDRMQVANVKTYLANTNAYIATKVSTTTFNQALANTNAYIASVSASGGGATWAALTSTNTALRTLISDRLQVANAAARYTTKAYAAANSYVKSILANTNSYIATKANDVGAANQILYRNSSNTLTGSQYFIYDGVSIKVNGNLESVYHNGDEGGEIFLQKPDTNTSLAAGVTIDVYQNKLRIFENGGSNRGAYIDISAASSGVGSNLLAGGGSSSNSFSGILVGSNVVVADSTSDRLTFVAGSGITIAANPSTDTITFSSTGGGGGGGFTNGQSISVTNLVVTGNTTLSALKYVPRVSSTSSISSPLNWNSDSFDQYVATAQATALTINADSGSPNNGQKIIFRFKDNGTARAISWTTGSAKSFRAIGITLPTTTVINKTLYVGCLYNSDDSRWDVIAVAQES